MQRPAIRVKAMFNNARPKIGAAFAGIYLISYCFLSYHGSYVEYIGAASDGHRAWYA